MELLLGMAVNKASTAKTGSWRTRKPLSVDMLPPCTDNCPAGIRIRDYLELVEKGLLPEARQLLLEDNPLPRLPAGFAIIPVKATVTVKTSMYR